MNYELFVIAGLTRNPKRQSVIPRLTRDLMIVQLLNLVRLRVKPAMTGLF